MICGAWRNRCRLPLNRTSVAKLVVAHEAQPHANRVNQIVAYQSGSDCQGKLRAGGGNQPMMIVSSVTSVSSVPPAVHNARGDRGYNHQCEPAARSIEESFGSAFPASQRQANQSENASNAHSDQ